MASTTRNNGNSSSQSNSDVYRRNDMLVLRMCLPRRRHYTRYISLLIALCVFSVVAHLNYTSSTERALSVRKKENSSGYGFHFFKWLGKLKHPRDQPVDLWVPVKDPHVFKYIHNVEHQCEGICVSSTDVSLVIFVNSAPKNVKKRAYIRRTFGNASAWPSQNGVSVMRIVFMIGAVDDPKLQAQIHYESVAFGDIVQETFIDNYFNMTRKTIMGMKWVTNFCRKAKYTLKIDDDIVLNVPRLLEILTLAPATNFSYGTVHWAKPVRQRKGPNRKFYTPPKVYPRKWYPPYLNGHAYVLSTDVVERVFHVSKELDLFPWSDVFIGMCMQRIGVRPRHSEHFVAYSFPMQNKTTFSLSQNRRDIMREYVSIYHQSEARMDQIWNVWTNSL